jgi:two-component system, OmpR family, sensor histidine kinase MprB
VSLRVRLGIAAGVAVAVAVIAVAVSSYAGTRSQLRSQVDRSLTGLAGGILGPGGGRGGPDGFGGPGGPGGPGQGGGPGASGSGFGFRGQRFGGEPAGVGDEGLGLDQRPVTPYGGARGITAVIHSDGTVYVPAGQSYRIPVNTRMKALAKSGRGRFFADERAKGTHLRVLITGISSRGALAVALPLTEVDRTLSRELLLIGLIAAGGIALAALLGLLVARTALAPIARFTRQAEAIADRPDRLEHERLQVSGRDELARLGRTFNTTLDALEASIAAQRNLVADASHELRTPIATIRANLQLMRDEALLSPEDREALRTDMIDELDELTQLVGDVVELARGSKATQAPGDVDLEAIVRAALDRARRRAPTLGFDATLEPAIVHGEGDRIARAVNNVLDNASKWSPPAGAVEVELKDGTLSVRDHGPGFHEEDLPLVFDRFHRARDARSKPGSGLGLAIVRQATEAHGGFAEAGNAPGGGALIRLNFGPPLKLETPPELTSGSR